MSFLNYMKNVGLILWDVCSFLGCLQFHRGTEDVGFVFIVYTLYSYMSLVIATVKPIPYFERAWCILCVCCCRYYVFISDNLLKINK